MAEGKPSIDPEFAEQIALARYQIQKRYSPQLKSFREDLPSVAQLLSGDSEPLPPKQPIALGKCLGEYATEIFDLDISLYPGSPFLPWLEDLARKVEERVMKHALSFEKIPPSAMLMGRPIRGGLTYHLSETNMREVIRAALKDRISKSRRPTHKTTSTEPLPPLAARPEQNHAALPPKKSRLPVTITSEIAARRMESFLKRTGTGQTEFATTLGITDRTLRTFRDTGIKRKTFDEIAAQMGTTRQKLMDPQDQTFR
ncbi:MAG: hypothetical protein ACLQDC_08215 [Verrucomicrobiia bacterium]